MSGKQAELGTLEVLVMHANDNVATCMMEMKAGDTVEVAIGNESKRILLLDPIPFGHKLALCHLDVGDEIVKYGEVIGRVSQHIEPGRHVHVHNVESGRARGDRP